MKILHILGTDRLSGAENVHLDILRALKDEDEVYYASPDGPIRESVEAAGVNFIPCDTDDVAELKKLYKEISPDVVDACDPRMSFKCARAGLPFISHLHANCPWMKKYSPNSFALGYTAKKARAVIVVSDVIAKDFVFRRAYADKLHVIPNTVDRERVERMAKEPFDAEFDVLFVGRFSEVKRPLTFLRLVCDLMRRIPSLRAAMVGEGELFEEAQRYIAEHSMENVKLLGFEPNPYKVMARSRVNVLTSSYEGFGLVAVEGMILGVPVVAYPSGGITEIAEAGGSVCATHEEMVDEVYRLLTDDAAYREASQRALAASYKYTDTASYFRKIKEIYSDFAKENR